MRYKLGKATDTEGERLEISEQEASAFLAEFWAASFAKMDAQLSLSKQNHASRNDADGVGI